ncbi:MAG TPA: UDP-N-acetylglucosamine--N-acetylmuramyl-(pentapeptide) pyrophosphoryl-undecaprenol N-acetylglucosamine transferase [Caldisericia bacterium]|nr:UDP-N-acetylglucosamine--N-acetylmuramyl-(pentapeptide) pyrophosphoryl-undecaprenol N-acetylglucosamine transferase [Caldisericia bacterium]
MKILISTGGTGGHIYPALIIGKYLKENDIDIFYTIGKREREIEILKESNEKFINLPIGAPSDKLFYFQIFISLFKSFSIIKKEKPDKVFAFGSYVSFPILFIARLLKIPYYLHEQNSIPGKVIKNFSKKAEKVFISFYESKNYLNSNNIVVSGMPVREKIGKIDKDEAFKRFNLKDNKMTFLLFGGSGGSKFLLDLVKEFEDEFFKLNLQGIIIKGNVKINQEFKFDSVVLDYINDIEYAYGASDFVISRGGASTIWEIIYSKKPAIVIPIKNSEHQNKNCELIKNYKIGVIFKEDDKDNFPKILNEFIKNLDEYKKNFTEFPFPDTKSIILKEILYDRKK